MPDASSYTTQDRDDFNKNHPNLLNEKHQTTIKNIQDLQDVEKYMFNNLQALNKSSPDSIQESDIIEARLNELSKMRLALFGQLKSMYKDTQQLTADNRSNLTDQITMSKVVENELQNAKDQLKVLKQEKLNKKRLVELGEYEYDRYRSHKNLLKVIAYGSLGVLFIVMLMGQPWFPSTVGVASICLIIGIVIITIINRVLTNWSRTNMNWNKFQYKSGCSNVNEAGECIVGGSSRDSWDWDKMFSDTCDNIASGYQTAKDKLLNVKATAEGKLQVTQLSDTEKSKQQQAQDDYLKCGSGKKMDPDTGNCIEGFTNIVQPTQPKGHEAFHSIF